MKDLLEHLNPAQRETVTHGEGPLLVLAGPGSGKTTVIVKRIQYLITQMHVPPEQILVITFTKDAARSMQQRFQRQSDKMLPVNFGTFHSVFYHIILEASHSKYPGQIKLLTEAQKKTLMIPILKKIRQSAGENCYAPDNMAADAGEMLSAVSFYKNTGDEAGAVGRLSREWKSCFRDVLHAYRQITVESGAMDFDDMVYECRRLLESDRELRRFWQQRFSHILIDEFQDINPMQYQVVKLLASEPYHLFAVGDDDQAIYGFRGSNPACLKQFEEEFRAKRVLLALNYRSRSGIVEAAGKVIDENEQRYPKELHAVQGEREGDATENPVKITSFPEREQQNEYLRARIVRFFEENPGKSCAVLFRTNIYMQSFGARLAKEGIAYTMREKARNIYEHFVVKDMMAYLQLAAGDRRRALFLQILNKPSRYLKREALAEQETVDFERMKRWYRADNSVHRMDYLDAIDRLQTQLGAMRKMSPYLAVQYVCKAVGYENWLSGQAKAADQGQERRQEWLEILEWLKEEAKGYGNVADWLEAQKKFSLAEEGRKCADSGEKGAVQLMTVHASKGLEFDQVWIPDCNEKNFPHGSMPEKDVVEEERRIFYVGMTRAKSNLELLWLTGTKERPRLMSRFLNPLTELIRPRPRP